MVTPAETLKAVQAVIDAAQITQRQRELNETVYVRAVDRWFRATDPRPLPIESGE